MKLLLSITLFVPIITLFSLITNCSDVDFSTAPDVEASGNHLTPEEIKDRTEEVKRNCSNAREANKLKTKTVDVFFEKPNKTCEWNKDGNLEPRDQFLQARIEQMEEFNLSDGSQICDLEFEFEQQKFHYDDLFLLTFNDSVLASAYDLEGTMKKLNGIYQYNWSDMVGDPWINAKEEVYCYGRQQGLTNCSFPGHDLPGQISLDISPELIQSIMGVNFGKKKHFFKIVTIGDNDDFDCEHDPLSFSVKIQYVQK
jgi:hypothetical protein